MAKKHGPALLDVSKFEVPQCLELASAVVAALPRDIDPNVAQGWIEPGNRRGLRKVLREALTPPQCVQPMRSVVAPTNWYQQLFGLAVAAGQFTDFCNTNVTGTNFPYVVGDLDDDVEEVEVAIDRDMSTADVRVLLESKGLEGASAFRALRWWLRHPERQNDCLVVVLGQEHEGCVVCVNGGGGNRRLNLDHVGRGWGRDCTFLAVRKVS